MESSSRQFSNIEAAATTRERAEPVPALEAEVILRRLLALRRAGDAGGATGSEAARQELVERLEGRIGWRELGPLIADDRTAGARAARALVCLGSPSEAFPLIARHDPRGGWDVVAAAARVVPELEPAALFEHRRWISKLLAAMLARPDRRELVAFVRALHARRHDELVAVIRGSAAGAAVPAEEWLLMDATTACWAGRDEEVAALLREARLGDERKLEGDVLRAIAARHVVDEPHEQVWSSLVERARASHDLDEAAERWRAEVLVRSGLLEDGAERAAIARVSDHPAVRLVHRIVDLRRGLQAPEKDPCRGFHTYVLASLDRAGVTEAREALLAEGTAEEEAALWRVLDQFGGNRTNMCTIIRGETVQRVDLRTARQEAVATQALLPARGAGDVLARLTALSAQHPEVSVFKTYLAEVHLWLGHYEEAASLFEAEVRTAATRWGEIGLGNALALLGREDEAERVWTAGHLRHGGALQGEATWVHRAELAAMHGDIETARALLGRVLAAKPTRARAWVLRAELAWREWQHAEARAALLQAFALCPGLATTVGPPPGFAGLLIDTQTPGATDRDAAIHGCRALRSAMRGNASSWLFTWYDVGDRLRAFQALAHHNLVLAFDMIAGMSAGA